MAKTPTGYTSPDTGILTEVYYSTDGTLAELKQIFGVQEVPSVITPKDPITYTTLESDEEFAVKGRRTYETIEVPVLYYEEQYDELTAVAATNTDVTYYLKFPDSTGGRVISWKGSMDVSSPTMNDEVLQHSVTLGKSTIPNVNAALPTT